MKKNVPKTRIRTAGLEKATMNKIHLPCIKDSHKQGWRFTPLKGKVPIRKGWQKETPADLETTLQWLEQGYNLGMLTGKVSGVIVLDVDCAKGGDVPKGLPPTPTVKTGGGGFHFYFAADGPPVKNSAGKVAPHVDIRGEGGQVVFPGSVHPETEAVYEWEEGLSPSDLPLVPFPMHLLEPPTPEEPVQRCVHEPFSDTVELESLHGYIRAALAREAEVVRQAPEGQRNDTLNRSAFSMGTLAPHGLAQVIAEGMLVAAAVEAGLSLPEAKKTFANGWDSGTQHPREAPAQSSSSWAEHRDQTAHMGGEVITPPLPFAASLSWEAPIPLVERRPTVEPFEPMLLPEAFRPWVEDVSERLQCPPDFTAVAIMVAFASLVGCRVGIRPKRLDDWCVIPNLWGAIVGPPGVMKSPTLKEGLVALGELEKKAKDEHERAMRDFQADQLVNEAIAKDLKKKLEKNAMNEGEAMKYARAIVDAQGEEEPQRRRFVVNDSTVEKLGEVLSCSPVGLLIFRDELIGFLKTLDKSGREADRSFYLEAWNGNGRFTYDRIGRGTVEIEVACVSILGGIQPGPLSQYMRDTVSGGAGQDGLIQRFQLLVWPDVSSAWRNVDRKPDAEARERALGVFHSLADCTAADMGADTDEDQEDGTPFLRFTPEAQEVFGEWRSELEHRLRSGHEHPAFVAHLAKFRSLIPSLALLIHLADGGQGNVGMWALERACAWGEYLESHARRMYSLSLDCGEDLAKQVLQHLSGGDLPNPFTARDVHRKGWAGLAELEDVKAALEVLEEHNFIQAQRVRTSGRPRDEYHINPELKEVAQWDDGLSNCEKMLRKPRTPY
jgi:hypothetical protein